MNMHMNMHMHMKHAPVFKGAAVVEMAFGVALLLAPNQLMALYNAEMLESAGLYNTMLYGGLLIGMAILHWMASQVPEASVRSIVIGTAVATTLGLIVALFRQLTDPAVPVTAWVNVFIFAVIAIAFLGLALQHAEDTGSAHHPAT